MNPFLSFIRFVVCNYKPADLGLQFQVLVCNNLAAGRGWTVVLSTSRSLVPKSEITEQVSVLISFAH